MSKRKYKMDKAQKGKDFKNYNIVLSDTLGE